MLVQVTSLSAPREEGPQWLGRGGGGFELVKESFLPPLIPKAASEKEGREALADLILFLFPLLKAPPSRLIVPFLPHYTTTMPSATAMHTTAAERKRKRSFLLPPTQTTPPPNDCALTKLPLRNQRGGLSLQILETSSDGSGHVYGLAKWEGGRRRGETLSIT